ncbi:DEAD/DEAH box helicase [Sphingomonas sp. RHCKR7]|uniref:DEAD/DEAH box helicase n=1 Tax=Sphingomonas folli TaxID=2862497 RepID=UPI001CA5249F|nr:DEAD/DEAH box helicase [Sphingomonas folli]MBW6528510.1 DEAD/DEAH box helicase [Sphingomonas folli]
MQELADQIWGNSRFHDAAALAHRTWLARELGRPIDPEVTMEEAVRLMQASAILACSNDPMHRRQAYRSATMTYEVVGAKTLPMQQALRVVLARLGNFPALETREDVGRAAADLPLDLAIEEMALSDRRRVLLRDRPALLTSFQHDLWSKLGEGRSIAVAAPTSAGKSFILQGHLARVFEEAEERTVVYLVPTRALIAQVARDLADLFRGTEAAPEILTVPLDEDQPLPKRAIFVMTQERTQLMLAAHADMSAEIVIVDEAHSIADQGRGILLQWVVDDLLRRRADAQLLFASPGIRNLDVFGRTFGLDSVETLPSTEPTVAQNFLIVRVTSSRQGEFSVSSIEPGGEEALVGEFVIGQTIASKKERLVQISAALGKGAPTIVYANGAAEAEDLAIQLADLFADRETTPRREALAQLVDQSVHPSYVLAAAVRGGVGFHYSNMPTQVRQAVEDAFADGAIDFLVCTSTLLQGVNLPARNVFMCRPEKGRQRPLEGTDFWNLAGRAGRLRREFQGNIFLIDYDEWKAKPLDHERDSEIVPALQDGVTQRLEDLVATIAYDDNDDRKSDGDLETLFVRLLDDHSRGELPTTLSRLTAAGVPSASAERVQAALDEAVEVLTLPVEVVRQSPNLSPHRQQALHAALLARAGRDKASVRALIPAHPRDSAAYTSYASLLRLCHTHLLGLPESHGSHRYHALMAVFWMSGDPLPKIIDNAINYDKKKSSRAVIRNTLETIEKVIRFEVVRLMSCYCAVLLQVMDEIGLSEMAGSVPPISLYLEVGASDRSMISFMGLGLSRVAAAILNDAAVNKDMTIAEARVWLKDATLEAYELSPLLVEEIRRVAR